MKNSLIESYDSGNVIDENLAGIALVKRELEKINVPSFRILVNNNRLGYISDGTKTFSKNIAGFYVSTYDPFLVNRIFISTNEPEKNNRIPKNLYMK